MSTPPPPFSPLADERNIHKIFASFFRDRIREPVTVEEQIYCRIDPIKTHRLRAIIKTWIKEHNAPISVDEILERMQKMFGNNGDDWTTIKAFTNDEDVAQWDLEHSP
jgi:hypothetical protein